MHEVFTGARKTWNDVKAEGVDVVIENDQTVDWFDVVWLAQMDSEDAAEDRMQETFGVE
jgi:hypothetical protein